MKKKTTRKLNTPNSKQSMDNMKYEIANEFGVNLGPDASSRSNGRVGGEITKRLVQKAGRKTNKASKRSSSKKSK